MKLIIPALLLSAACTGVQPVNKTPCTDHTTTAVHLPNGETGAVICCASKTDCYQESYKVCNAYYVLQADDVKVSEFTSHDNAVEYVIQCHPILPPK